MFLFDNRASFYYSGFYCSTTKGFLMERVPLFSDTADTALENTSVGENICADIRSVRDYIFDLYGGLYEDASLHVLEPDDVVIFWEDDDFSTSVILGGGEKEARVESGETGSALSLSSFGDLKWVLDSLEEMRRILSFDV